MRNLLIACFLFLSLLNPNNLLHGDDMGLIAFYAARKVSSEPVIDGKLDDPQWKSAFPDNYYYKFGKTYSGRTTLTTELKIVWTENGITVGIINYDSRANRIKCAASTFDSKDLWRDECAEMYFDPKGSSIGFSKFTVNAMGTRGDMRRIDTAISQDDWNGNGWRAATKIYYNRWVLEAFFPWEDLGAQAKTGEIWKFEHIRFCYTWSRFMGTVWSAGGMHSRPQNFGYLYFFEKESPTPSQAGALLSMKVKPPWMLLYGKKLIRCKEAGKFDCRNFKEIKTELQSKINIKLAQVEKISDNSKRLPQLKLEIKNALSLKGFDLSRIQKIEDELDKMLWELKLNNFLKELK